MYRFFRSLIPLARTPTINKTILIPFLSRNISYLSFPSNVVPSRIRQHLPFVNTFSSRSYTSISEIIYPPPVVTVGNLAPTFTAPAVINGDISSISLKDCLGSYVVLFFYPKDFTFVCPTEIIAFSDRTKEFEAINTKVIAVSTDTEETHLAWIRTPRKKGGLGFMQIPIVADTTKEISNKYGVLIEKLGIALRGLFIINPDGMVEQITINNLPVGRSVDETLRLVKAFQFVAKHGEVCPANWKPGDKTMIPNPNDSLDYFATGATESTEDFPTFPTVKEIKSSTDFQNLMASKNPVVVDFMAPWCGKCRMIMPYFGELSNEYKNITFAKFDITLDSLQELSAKLGIKDAHLPTFRFFMAGKEVLEPVVGYKRNFVLDAIKTLQEKYQI